MPVTELSSLLVETFGGLSPPLVDALRRCDVLGGGGVAQEQADGVRVRRDDLVSADVDGLRDAAAFRCVAAVDGAGGGGGPRPLGGGRPTCALRV